jgi:hypothetical protein
MPMLRRRVTATSADIFANDVLSNLPRAALISLFAVGANVADSIAVNSGSQVIIPAGTVINTEGATSVVQTNRDQLLFREAVQPGKISVGLTLAGASAVAQLNIEYL